MDVETCPAPAFSTTNIEQNFEEMSDAFVLGDSDKMSECMTFVNECISHWREGHLLRNIDYEDLLHNVRVAHRVSPAPHQEVEAAKARVAAIIKDLSHGTRNYSAVEQAVIQ